MRNAISIVLIVILVPVTVVLLLVTSVKINLVTPDFIKTELRNQNVYTVAVDQIDRQVRKLVIDPQYPITHEEIIDELHRIVTPAWLQQNVERSIDNAAAWLNAPAGTALTLLVDLRQPKTQLAASLDSLLTEKLADLKPCPNRRQPKEEQGICQFAGMNVPQLKEQLAHAGIDLANIQTLLPDSLDLLNPDVSKIAGPADADDPNGAAAKSSEIQSRAEQIKARYQQVMSLLKMAWLIFALFIVLFLALNAQRGWRRLARWTGVLFLTIGLLPLTIGILSKPALERYAIPKIHFASGVPPELPGMALGAIRDVQHAVFTMILAIGAVLVTLGLGGIIGAHWLPKPIPAKK